MPSTGPYLTYTELETAISVDNISSGEAISYESTTPDLQTTTPLAFVIGTSFIAVLPLVFLISVILAFYISLKRHRQQNTYGLAPTIVVTRTRGRRKSSHKTMETTLYSDYSKYSTCDDRESNWSINTSANTGEEREDKNAATNPPKIA